MKKMRLSRSERELEALCEAVRAILEGVRVKRPVYILLTTN